MSTSSQNGHLAKKLQELCKALTIERNLSAEIWKHFCLYYSDFVLSGEPVHWLGCALYLKSTSSASSRTSLNFTKLLRCTNMSLIDFFQKTKQWAEHCNLPDENLVKFENLQRGFAVSMVAFKKFRPIFNDMFIDPNVIEASKSFKTNKRTKVHPPTTKKLFEFTWALYICVKSSFPEVRDDLVHSYHLLLAACDFVFTNAFLSDRKDIINPKFPDCTSTSRFTQNCDVPCIIDILCERHNGVKMEAKQIKEYSWKKQIKTLFDKKYLKGDSDLFINVLDPTHFESNNKNIEKLYDDYILSVGAFDERLYLANSFLTEIAGSGLQERIDDISFQLESKRKMVGLQLKVNTPLTGRKYFKDSYSSNLFSYSASSSFNNIATLQVMLFGRTAEPTPLLQKIIKTCGEITPSIETRVSDMAQMVYAHFTERTSNNDPWSEDLALSRVDISKKLYYRFLEKLLTREMARPTFDGNLLNQDVFHKTLFACAVDLIIFTYRSPWIFPWILETLHISAYHFSRIIEVVVRADELLSREMVKHLSWIEEIVLESLAWKSDSPLWKTIADTNLPIPSCEDVSVKPIMPVKLEKSNSESSVEVTEECIVPSEENDKLNSLAGSQSILIDSPGVSLTDKFQSPMNPSLKRPINSSLSNEPPKKVIILNDSNAKSNDSSKEKPKRTGSMALFFRKFYYLSSVRLQNMLDQLSLSDVSLRQKIWTSFELTIINHTNLMIDRHLDQILMCSIYVICKIVGPEQKFTHMMKCYRNQPQAQSKVYRNVLLGPERTIQDLLSVNGSKRFIPDNGDIIKFYNKVFVNEVEDLVRKFKNSSMETNRIVLSPIPNNASLAVQSPRRLVSDNHSIYVRCLNEKSPLTPNSPHLSYLFSQSPATSLRAINHCISQDFIKGKRLTILTDDDSENSKDFNNSTSTSAYNQKLKALFNERQADLHQKATN